MPDWSASMIQTFEYYIVDPGTWKDKKLIPEVSKCTINRDSGVETLGSSIIDIHGSMDECYVRAYLITIQNGIREKHPLGTFLVQSPALNSDGKTITNSMDAYTPLLELKENPPPIGYYVPKDTNIMDVVYRLSREHMRAPIVAPVCDMTLHDNFVADINDTWMSFLSDLASNANYEFALDEMGRVLFSPKQDTASLQPVWTYTDDNSSILYPSASVDRDLYGIPNAVEVIYSNGKTNYSAKVVNDNVNSPISTVNRGREILYRDTNPALIGNPTEEQVRLYAKQLLRDLSSVEYTVTYSHGYCPVRLGDCVRINHSGAGLKGVKAKVISQSIDCETSCKVTEKAVYTTNLWG